jgi:hypothetical protein
MPIILTPFTHGKLVQGNTWTVVDEDELARHIARVALGQSRHVQKILMGSALTLQPTTTRNAADCAIELLTVQGSDPSHRDGWMFQVISWVAAYKASPNGIIRAPHMIAADKGFDGLQLELDAAKKVSAAIIFEDKATINPRETIRGDVWPEFTAFETGKSENVLTAEVSALLSTQPGIDPDIAIQNIIWKSARRYRISITVGDQHRDEEGRRQLFKGFDNVVGGKLNKRQGETIYLPTLRQWMQSVAKKAIAEIKLKAK